MNLGVFHKIMKEKNFLSLSGNMIFAGLGLVSFLLLVRSLDKQAFGEWVLFMTIATFVDLFRFGLTRNAIIRFSSSGNEVIAGNMMGTSYFMGLVLVLACMVFLWPVFFIFGESTGAYLLFFKYYPLYALANLSWNNAISFLQAEQKFGRILFIRLFNMAGFVLFLIFNLIFWRLGVETLLMVNIITNFLSSIASIVSGRDGLKHIRKTRWATVRKLSGYGVFSIGSTIGSSLLKSADVFIIGLNPLMGTIAVAIYSIPLKLVEMINIPLRSFIATAFPRMSKASLENDPEKLKELFYTYSGALTLLFTLISLGGFFLARPLVLFLGGREYLDSVELLVWVFRIFCIYGLMLPLDRMLGVALDSLGYPRLNMYKVMVMAALNIAGDLVMVFVFESLSGVALVTLFFTLIGLYFGDRYLKRYLEIRLWQIFPYGIKFYTELVKKGKTAFSSA